jgi:hypothetical protein
MNRNLVLTFLVLVMGISLSIVGQNGSDMINSASAQTTMDNGTDATTMAQGNMTAGAGNMTDSNATASGNISGVGGNPF